ncbi:lipoprotein [Filimonas lacunae]|nr:lipoprotein [Filimonas lacunae]
MLMAACGGSRKTTRSYETIILKGDTVAIPRNATDSAMMRNELLRQKFANYLNTSTDSILNLPLYRFIDKWLNTPYLWGGTDERGIDCSAFIQRLLSDVYRIDIPRTSIQQFFTRSVEPFAGRHYLSEGDLVFFRTTEGKVVSHVGLYLSNHMFINASVSRGVSIASLNDPYWKKRYVAAGRVKVNKNSTAHK